ncbi:hypothetical protein D9613_006456 [Agrocybe pediades]|uniref:HMG box domain-containing protein n=1 Tax=Agrocybe pediades TaxID=84607 RepID=A0A8H4QHE2_9AGAR|nr:hypothetical protein D9613_006456 [Agrocybe pediades]
MGGKKFDEDGKPHIPRPRNSFLIFRMSLSKEFLNLSEERWIVSSQGRVGVRSKVASRLWKQMDASERKLWEDKAQEEKDQHMMKYPDYQYRPGKSSGVKGRSQPKQGARKKGRKVKEAEDEYSDYVEELEEERVAGPSRLPAGNRRRKARESAHPYSSTSTRLKRQQPEQTVTIQPYTSLQHELDGWPYNEDFVHFQNGSWGYGVALQPAMYPTYAAFAGWGGSNHLGAYTLSPADVRHYPRFSDLGDGSAQSLEVLRYPDEDWQIYQGLPTEQAAATRSEFQNPEPWRDLLPYEYSEAPYNDSKTFEELDSLFYSSPYKFKFP